jgi:hypothetical protein
LATREKAPIRRRLSLGQLFSGGLLAWRAKWTKNVHQNVDQAQRQPGLALP